MASPILSPSDPLGYSETLVEDGTPKQVSPNSYIGSSSPLKTHGAKHSISNRPSSRGNPSVEPTDHENPDQEQSQLEQVDIQALVDKHARKFKRDIQENFNEIRAQKQLPRLHVDLLAGLIADDYAGYLKTNEHEEDILRQICEDFNSFGDLKFMYGVSNFEESGVVPPNFEEEVLDLGYTLLDTQKYRDILLDPEINHIGIGIAADNERFAIVALLSRKDIMCERN